GREDHVEGGVGVGEVLRVAHLEGYLHALGPGASLGVLYGLGGGVHPGHLAEAAGGGDGGVAAAGCHVEDLIAGAEVDRLAQQLASDDEGVADPGVLVRGPDLVHPFLDGGHVGRL
ncbi:MAG: hypothetical protein AVDCRST_MAG22-1199, partial [uncultured Rubrobacteraceae bacterium]